VQSPGEQSNFFKEVQATANNASKTMTFNPYDILPKDQSYW
jgi:hypothetical protein